MFLQAEKKAHEESLKIEAKLTCPSCGAKIHLTKKLKDIKEKDSEV